MSKITEFYRRYRPTNFDEVFGQQEAVTLLKSKIQNRDLNHVVMLVGPSGSGKTTLARICSRELGCEPKEASFSYQEINCADVRGIDSVREIGLSQRLAPMTGSCRVFVLDEVVQLPKATQQAFLKTLEETSKRAWFFLCTSDTSGLLPTFVSRCLVLTLRSLQDKPMLQMLQHVHQQAYQSKDLANAVYDTVQNEIVKKAQGNARLAVQLLEVASTVEEEEQQLQLIGVTGLKTEEVAEFLGRKLFNACLWPTIQSVLQKIDDKEVETTRRQVLAYMEKVLLGKGDWAQAEFIIRHLKYSFAESGKAGLVSACYQVVLHNNQKKKE